jgi:hypothetical protein
MPQLRTFSAYTKNANAGVNLFARQCALSNIDGNYLTGAAGQYFQIHDKATAPVNADVPVKSFLLANAGPINLMSIFQVLGPMNFVNGLGVAISSTEATLTLGTGSFDVFGEIEEYELPISGLSVVGDLTTAISSLSIWTEANGPQKLYTIEIPAGNGLSSSVYLMLFAKDTGNISNGDVPLWTSPVISSSSLRQYFTFGSAGIWPRVNDSGTYRQGASLWLSSTQGILTKSVSTCPIKAQYKVS